MLNQIRSFKHFCRVLSVTVALVFSLTAATSGHSMKIGIIGTGKIGSALATHWAHAGHQLVISSRKPDELRELAQALGPNVRVGTAREAAAFGDVILLSIPYGATPQIGRDYAKELAHKIVLDTGNPYPGRDGAMADDAQKKGTGVASAEYLPGVRLVRAFNSVPAGDLKDGANHKPARYAVPLAADDAGALAVAERLVRDAGFDYVVVGGLARAKEFDVNTPAYGKALTAAQLRTALGLPGSQEPAAGK